MAASNFPIPPTFADPMEKDPVTGEPRFNPMWINWFLQCAAYFTNLNSSVNSSTITANTVKTAIVEQNGTSLAIQDAGGNTVISIVFPSNLGFFGATPVTKPTVTGSKGANAALASLMTALSSLGLVTDSTT